MKYLDLSEQPKYEKRISIAYYLSFISQGLAASIFGPAMVWFAGRTGSTAAQITPVLFFYNIGYILSSLFLSNLFDRKPGNRLMAGGLCVLIAVMPGFSFVRSRLLLFLLALILGSSIGVVDNGGDTLFPWLLHERAKRPLNLIHLCYSAGSTVTPILIGIALRRWGMVSPVFILLSLLIICPAVMLFRLPSPRPERNRIAASSAGSADDGMKQILFAASTYGLLLFLFSSCQSTFSNWTSTVLLRNGLADESTAAMMASLFWGGTFTGRVLAAWLVKKQDPEKIVRSCLLIAIANGIVMFFGRSSLILTGVCVFFNGFATGPIIANVFSIMKGKGLVSAKINGIVHACGQFGSMAIPFLFGRIYGDSTASYIPFVIITLGASAAELIVLTSILRKGQNQPRRS